MIKELLIYIVGLFIGSEIYSRISNQNPKNLLEQKEISNAIQKMNGVWWFMIPLTNALVFIYNICCKAIWFIGVLLNFVIKYIKWFYNEVIEVGLFMICRILWHYLIKYPWNLFIKSFEFIKASANWTNFKIGFYSLLTCFGIAYLGNFLVQEYQFGSGFAHVMNLISIFPLGFGTIRLISNQLGDSTNDSTNRNKFIQFGSILIASFGIIILVEGAIIKIAATIGFATTLSSIWAGGTILGSALLILNALLLIFIISALPSFVMNYSGTYKTIMKDFGLYVYQNGMRHFIAAPVSIVAIGLLCAIPYFLTTGTLSVSKEITTKILDKEIAENNQKSSEIKEINYSNWTDLSKCNDSCLKAEMQLDIKQKEHSSTNDIERVKNYLNAFYSKYNNPIAAAPIGIAYLGYQKYASIISSNIQTEAIAGKNMIDSSIYLNEINNAIKDTLDWRNMLNAETMTSAPEVTTEAPAADPAVAEPAPADTAIAIPAVVATNNEPAVTNATGSDTKKNLDRRKLILTHFAQLREQALSAGSGSNFSDKLGHLILTLWLCILAAATLSLGFVLFSLLNHSIYNENKPGSGTYLVDQINNARKANVNQPFLSLAILFALFYLNATNNLDPSKISNKLLNLISNDHAANSSDQTTIDSTVLPPTVNDANPYEEPVSAPTEIIYDSTSMMMGE